ncbi:MAG TPA: hypothetical protein VJ792_05945 [Candidatus Nitrosotalea sp.]|nr:hypothetical protein [Candidatus Nitrosotalea sp.]
MPAALYLLDIIPPEPVQIASFAFLAAAFFLDAKTTISCRDFIRYESNPLFRFLARRMPVGKAVISQAAAEAAILGLTGLVMGHGLEMPSLAAISQVFCLAHIFAWISNRSFLGRCRKMAVR